MTTCISWRHCARVQAAGSWQRHWAGSLPWGSAMPFPDKCSDPNTVYQCLFPSARYLVLQFPFFPTSLWVSLLTTLDRFCRVCPLFLTRFFPTLPSRRHVSESSSLFRRTCTSAGSSPASRETAYVTFYETVHKTSWSSSSQPTDPLQSPVADSPLCHSTTLRFHLLGAVSSPSPPSFDPSTVSLVALPSLALIDKAWCVRTNRLAVSTFGGFPTRWWHAERFFV